ncbi:MAG: hypothetical protein PHD32_01275 [Eubacteriales bacterium]|nr:hypothetical protein [Eubacteriales bacterium]
MKKYVLRFSWYLGWKLLAVLLIFAAMFAAFFIAMDSANVYVVVTDGLKERASAVLHDEGTGGLTSYFDTAYLAGDTQLNGQTYRKYNVTDFIYHLKVESLWCQPWAGVARITVVESIPEINGTLKEKSNDERSGESTQAVLPAWTRGRYVLTCRKENDRWLVTEMELTAVLEPEPTPSPDPADATATPSAAPSPTASAQAAGE